MSLKSQKKNKWKNKYENLECASNFHHKLQEILLDEPFKSIEAFQEVELSSLLDTKNILFVDWYIPSFKLCIELHGVQHYKAISFVKQDLVKTELDFIASKNRDSTKKLLLEEAGYCLLEISYKDYKLLDKDYLLNRISETIRSQNEIQKS